MSAISLSVRIEAPLHHVWAHLADLPSHAHWMSDVTSIEFPTGQRSGVGTQMVVSTRVGPLQTRDRIEVTIWDEPRRVAVQHQGFVKGLGEFRLEDERAGTRLIWNETLEFPWYLGGRLTGLIARPVLVRIWRRNLARFRNLVLSDP